MARGGVVAVERDGALERAQRIAAAARGEIGEPEVILDLGRLGRALGRALERAHRARGVSALERLRALAVQARALDRAASEQLRAQRGREDAARASAAIAMRRIS